MFRLVFVPERRKFGPLFGLFRKHFLFQAPKFRLFRLSKFSHGHTKTLNYPMRYLAPTL